MKLEKQLCSTDLQILLRTVYEEVYGIVDHSGLQDDPNERAFSLVTLNDNEDIYKHDMMRARAKRFAMLRVGHYFNMSWDAFIQQPHSTCEMLFEVTEELIAADKPVMQDLVKELS